MAARRHAPFLSRGQVLWILPGPLAVAGKAATVQVLGIGSRRPVGWLADGRPVNTATVVGFVLAAVALGQCRAVCRALQCHHVGIGCAAVIVRMGLERLDPNVIAAADVNGIEQAAGSPRFEQCFTTAKVGYGAADRLAIIARAAVGRTQGGRVDR